jgi:hypothetical protein
VDEKRATWQRTTTPTLPFQLKPLNAEISQFDAPKNVFHSIGSMRAGVVQRSGGRHYENNTSS